MDRDEEFFRGNFQISAEARFVFPFSRNPDYGFSGMDLPEAIDLCLSFPGAEESTPFGPDHLVYKIGGKIFAITTPGDFPSRINLKCDPARAISLRDQYEAVIPGFHMNKQHWNTVILDGSVPGKLISELVRHSYDLIVKSLPKSKRP